MLVHILDLVLEALRKARRFTEPVIGILFEVCGAREWWCRGEVVRGEDGLVLNFTVNPGLDVFDVGWCREVDWIAFRVYPGVRRPVHLRQSLTRRWPSIEILTVLRS